MGVRFDCRTCVFGWSFGSRLKTVLVWYDESAGSVWSVWLHVVYGRCLLELQEWSLFGNSNAPSLRKRLRFRTGVLLWFMDSLAEGTIGWQIWRFGWNLLTDGDNFDYERRPHGCFPMVAMGMRCVSVVWRKAKAYDPNGWTVS